MMQASGFFLVILLIAAVVVILATRWLTKRDMFKNRVLLEMDDAYRSEFAPEVSYDIFKDVIHAVGSAFHVDPRLLRPSDQLKKLYELDSWDVGEGTEQLNSWLEKECGITHFEKEPVTIAELMVVVESAKQENSFH